MSKSTFRREIATKDGFLILHTHLQASYVEDKRRKCFALSYFGSVTPPPTRTPLAPFMHAAILYKYLQFYRTRRALRLRVAPRRSKGVRTRSGTDRWAVNSLVEKSSAIATLRRVKCANKTYQKPLYFLLSRAARLI